jgi:hypothetical protein
MKKIVKITESDLKRIVRRIIKESETSQDLMSKEKVEKFNLSKKSISGCFSSGKNPNLSNLFKNLARLQLSVWEFELVLFAAVGVVVISLFGGIEVGVAAFGLTATEMTAFLATVSSISGWVYLIFSHMIEDFNYAVSEVSKSLKKNPKLYFKELSNLSGCVYEELSSLVDWW